MAHKRVKLIFASRITITMTVNSPQRDRKGRTKTLVPSDRKLFFSIVSLLVDPALMPPDGEVEGSLIAVEQYVPTEVLPLIQKLSETLQWDCA